MDSTPTPNPPAAPDLNAKLARVRELEARKKRRKQAKLAKARRDYRAFAQYCLKDDLTGEAIELAPIHHSWINHVDFAWQHNLGAIILAPPSHGKTAHFGIGMPLFIFGQSTSLRILLLSANDALARDRLGAIRGYVERSEEYHELFPNVRPDYDRGWTKGQFFLQRPSIGAKDPSLIACGITSSAIGRRADILILDDVNDEKNTLHHPGMREVIWRKFTGPILSRLEPWGQVVAICTRWHEQDLVGRILEDETMRNKYAFLIQRVGDDMNHIVCETIVPSTLKAQAPKGRGHAALDRLFAFYEAGVI